MKKILIFFIVLTFCMGANHVVFAQQNGPTQVVPQIQSGSTNADYSDDPCDPNNLKDGQDCYQLLESIPLQDKTVDSVDTTASGESGLGGFLNFIFEIGIGIAGVLGVVMLVIYGFRYAANDKNVATFGKLKEKITSVILGLLLLLGIFVILNTINPDLLVVEPEIKLQNLDIDEQGDGVDPSSGGGFIQAPTGTKTITCPAGIVAVQGVNVCKNIADQVDAMLIAAKSQNIPLSGGGWRSPQQQVNLRNRNCSCGGNNQCIYNKPAKQCRPPTGIPGRSRHESGLAIDFTCNGSTMRKGSSCYVWMQNNAAKYGFYNYPVESWHWSIDGH